MSYFIGVTTRQKVALSLSAKKYVSLMPSADPEDHSNEEKFVMAISGVTVFVRGRAVLVLMFNIHTQVLVLYQIFV